MLVFTDPDRTPDLQALATALPEGSGLVYRHFGTDDALEQAHRLRRLTRDAGALLLIGADHRLADAVDADGLHLPERLAHRLPRILSRRPAWYVTAAAHSPAAGRRGLRLGADAVVVSTLFASASPSAGDPIGAIAFKRLIRRLDGPVYALGGVNMQTIAELRGSGAVGVAVVGAASAAGAS